MRPTARTANGSNSAAGHPYTFPGQIRLTPQVGVPGGVVPAALNLSSAWAGIGSGVVPGSPSPADFRALTRRLSRHSSHLLRTFLRQVRLLEGNPAP